MARTITFHDHHGNRMMFPSFIQWGKETDLSSSSINGRLLTICMLITDLTMEDWYEFDAEKFPHFKTEILSRGFEHGAATVYLFEGPEFDRIMAENKDPDL